MSRKLLRRIAAAAMAVSFCLSVGQGAMAYTMDDISGYNEVSGGYNIKTEQTGTITFSDEPIAEYPENAGISLYSFSGRNSYNFASLLTSSQLSMYNRMLEVLAADPGAERFTISVPAQYNIFTDGQLIQDDLSQAFIALVQDYPEYIGLRMVDGLRFSSATPDVAQTGFIYCDGQQAGTTAVNSYMAVQNKVASIVNASSVYTSDYDKLKFFAEYICDNNIYNEYAFRTGVGANCWNAYGSLINGTGVCESYAEAYKLLCDAVSIPCVIAISSNHEWNIVYLGGAWYYVDVTWMDSYATNGMYNYTWFLAGTSEAAAADHDSAHVLSDSGVLMGYHNLKYPQVNPTAYVPGGNGNISDEQRAAAEGFVSRLYEKVLNRPAAYEEVSGWADYLLNGSTAVEVSYGFIYSPEFAGRGLSNDRIAEIFYNTFLDRAPAPDEVKYWSDMLKNGCSLDRLMYGFSQSAEFSNICSKYGLNRGYFEIIYNRDMNPSLTAYVSRMYTKAMGRDYEVGGLEYWTGRYISGEINANQIAEGFIYSPEFVMKNLSDEDYVETLYQTFFDRESDPAGKSGWVGMLKSGATREQILNGFLGSPEYANLVSSFGI
ncbi:MAG: DUF4214 domain-containing protein [Oscillospiraceae bacterium]|nr:DUF4214 domain-containing protein [Oscillospiraceae bacterium]